MPGRLVVVGNEAAVFGLGLLGLQGIAVTSAAEAEAVLVRLVADPSVALVLLTEEWAESQRALIDAAMAGGGPLIIDIPAAKPASHSLALQERLEQALGIRLEG